MRFFYFLLWYFAIPAAFAWEANGDTQYGNNPDFRCQPMGLNPCKGLGYNFSAWPNLLGMESEGEAAHSYATFTPLVRYSCSTRLHFLLCAFHAPMCAPGVPIAVGPCRPVCESVRNRCQPILHSLGFAWPDKLNCSRLPPANDERQMCMEGPPETSWPFAMNLPQRPLQSFQPNQEIRRYSHSLPKHPIRCPYGPSGLYTYVNSSGRCVRLCNADSSFSEADKAFASVWLAVWGAAAGGVGLGAAATLLLDASLVRYPDRAAAHVCICHGVVAAAYLTRLGFGRAAAGCAQDPATGLVIAAMEDAFGPPCVTIFVLIYYFTNAAGVWWVLYCACMLARACGFLRTPQHISPRSAWLHGIAWGAPAALAAAALLYRAISAEELTGLCSAGGLNPASAFRWSVVPQLSIVFCGGGLVVCALAALWRRHKTESSGVQVTGGRHNSTDVAAARLALIAALYMVPATCTASIRLYELWPADESLIRSVPSKVGVELGLLRVFSCVAPGITIGLLLVDATIIKAWTSFVSLTCRKLFPCYSKDKKISPYNNGERVRMVQPCSTGSSGTSSKSPKLRLEMRSAHHKEEPFEVISAAVKPIQSPCGFVCPDHGNLKHDGQ